jgi:hypothetical protein
LTCRWAFDTIYFTERAAFAKSPTSPFFVSRFEAKLMERGNDSSFHFFISGVLVGRLGGSTRKAGKNF